jgi:hypothetical protein
MSQSALHAAAFYKEVAKTRVLWTIRDSGGFPAPMTSSGHRAQPFWSSRSRAARVIKNVPAYADFEPIEVSWDEFCSSWVHKLTRDQIKVGVNWSGKNAEGYDLDPDFVQRAVQATIASTIAPDLDDDLSDEVECMTCGLIIPAGAEKCCSCGWSYR